ncbi:hypothetical protein QL285_066436 [Trifolium repens]|nr:hypothetical protein QL285_066436 [Trifolium repens]
MEMFVTCEDVVANHEFAKTNLEAAKTNHEAKVGPKTEFFLIALIDILSCRKKQLKEDKFEDTAAKTNPGPKIEELFNSPEHSELQKKAIEGLEITEEEIKEAFSLPIEDLFNRLEYSELLNKSNDFAGAGPKSCESCEEALKDFGGAPNSEATDPTSCEDAAKGLWKFFKKFEECHSDRR